MLGRTASRIALGALAATCAGGAGAQENLADIYKGKTVQIVVGTSPGGGYDAYARTMSRFMGRHLPGEPNVIVSNMPGAGSNVMSAYVANVAPKDGTVIGAPFSTQPLAAILEDVAKVRFDPRKLHYLGSATTDYLICLAGSTSPVQTFADAFKTEMVMGGTAETGSTGYLPVMLNNVLGTKFRIVFGYPGSREITAAIEKGELHGMCGLNLASINSQYSGLLKEGRIKLLAQESMEGHPDLNKQGVPRTGDFATTAEQRGILEIIYSQAVFARPYFVAGEVAAPRVTMLRKAFLDTWRDPDLMAEMKKMNLDVDTTSGEDLQKLLAKVYAAPPDLVEKTREAIKVKR